MLPFTSSGCSLRCGSLASRLVGWPADRAIRPASAPGQPCLGWLASTAAAVAQLVSWPAGMLFVFLFFIFRPIGQAIVLLQVTRQKKTKNKKHQQTKNKQKQKQQKTQKQENKTTNKKQKQKTQTKQIKNKHKIKTTYI